MDKDSILRDLNTLAPRMHGHITVIQQQLGKFNVDAQLTSKRAYKSLVDDMHELRVLLNQAALADDSPLPEISTEDSPTVLQLTGGQA